MEIVTNARIKRLAMLRRNAIVGEYFGCVVVVVVVVFLLASVVSCSFALFLFRFVFVRYFPRQQLESK